MKKLFYYFIQLAALVSSGTLYANMSAPYEPDSASLSGEFIARFVSVEKEVLTIDLTPLAANQPARIKAIYHIKAEKPLDNLDLLFIGVGSDSTSYKVLVNGLEVTGAIVFDPKIYNQWQVPDSIRFAGLSIPFSYKHTGYWKFSTPIAEGNSTIEVSYNAIPGQNFGNYYNPSSSIIWELAYILSPARTWKQFNELDLSVTYPEDWEIYSNIELTGIENKLMAHWNKLPADFLTFTLKKPDGTAVTLSSFFLYGSWTIIIVVALILLYKTAKRRAENKMKLWMTFLINPAIAIGFTILFFAIYIWHYAILELMLGSQKDPNEGRGAGYAAAIAGPFILLIALTVGSGILFFAKNYIEKKQKSK